MIHVADSEIFITYAVVIAVVFGVAAFMLKRAS
jgi:hypothetical protein